MRLDKFICKSTELTRTEAKKLLKKGEVTVNNEVITNPATQVHENNDIRVDGSQLIARQSRYIMLHKPVDTICSNVDELYPSVLHFLDIDKAFDMHIAGRLDADTTGLVLITDDGRWSHNIISPKKACEKTYRVWLRDALKPDTAEQFASGVQLQGERDLTRPAVLEMVEPKEVLLTITEGKYHQVKRMFAAVGNKVVGLHRESIGSVKLGELELGEWRYLTSDEVAHFL
ncbi:MULTISPECIES: 16S rRNA pseudouridine(516) synthase RsuA [Thalassotalea]|uniref:16S rRNA pseudouridine(516) synthase RsuA n=1 Tax=Thalassotalea TaxID=1518149 RepID=UPI0009431A74|nr:MULTISPECIES: 16S rRNA pseudouridine(516) synthase RsuA [Thalassotalea]OKY25323.1 16S rRNA pseudouridine(516) synthase [Thalassotalea sp. PP2-459]